MGIRVGRAPTHRLVTVVLTVVILVAAAVLATGWIGLGRVDRSVEQARVHLAPAAASLASAQQHWTAFDNANNAVAAGDLSAVGASLSESSAAAADWDRYAATPAVLPGEETLRADYRAAVDQFNSAVASITANPQLSNLASGMHAVYLKLVEPIAGLGQLYGAQLTLALDAAHDGVGSAHRDVIVAGAVAALVVAVVSGLMLHVIRLRQRVIAGRDEEQLRVARRGELETRLQRGLALVNNEEASYRLIERALHTAAPNVPAELLVADSSRAHFRQAAATDAAAPGCGVSSPMECPAVTRGQTQVWRSTRELDTCPWLTAGPPCSATCVPVSIAGKTIGVLHATGVDRQPPEREVIDNLELVARKAGERVGMLRAFARSETQARTDALTGLFNRRSLEARLRELADDGHPYVVAFGDLDHFKMLNDVHGHDAGDRALRLFARVLGESVRPNDITARYGGEEFLVVLPDCSVPDAVEVLERIRERLAASLQSGSVPPFTVSFGVATSRVDAPYAETIDTADEALLRAKGAGRNRVFVAGEADVDAVPLVNAHVGSGGVDVV
jgi:diguanylate cyclase (GGDEF)-like protein